MRRSLRTRLPGVGGGQEPVDESGHVGAGVSYDTGFSQGAGSPDAGGSQGADHAIDEGSHPDELGEAAHDLNVAQDLWPEIWLSDSE